jgi:hypothetical protein
LHIQIFVSENEYAVSSPRSLLRDPKSASVAQVKVSGGRRRNAPAIFAMLVQSPEV